MKKHLLGLFITILLSIGMFSAIVYAEGTTQIVETQNGNDEIIMYVSGISPNASNVEYQIGTVKSEAYIDGYTENIYTVILWDNSLSVMSKNDSKVRKLLTQIVSSGADGEQFAIYALSDRPNLLIDFTSDYNSLKRVIDNTKIENKDAYVVENLHDIVKEINDGRSEDFYRIIVISDGVDSSSLGASKSELDSVLDVHKYPVYTISVNGKNNEDLKNLYSLSRNTGAQYFEYSGNDTEIVNSLREGVAVVRIDCMIPAELRNGSRVNTRLTVDGISYEALVQMPWAEITDEVTGSDEGDSIGEDADDGVPEGTGTDVVKPPKKDDGPKKDIPAPKLGKNKKEADGFWESLLERFTLTGIIIIITVIVVLISIIIIIVLLSGAKKRKALYEDENRIQMYDKLDMELENGWKNRAESSTELYGNGVPNVNDTLLLFDQPGMGMGSGRMVVLSNIDLPGISYQAPITGVITVGRENYNTITIENDRSVSKTHCEIFEMGGELYIKDAGSSNGTYLGPKDASPRLTGPELLMNNATVTIGQYLYSVSIM